MLLYKHVCIIFHFFHLIFKKNYEFFESKKFKISISASPINLHGKQVVVNGRKTTTYIKTFFSGSEVESWNLFFFLNLKHEN